MTETFVLHGDPGSIRASASQWTRFSGDTSGAGSDLRNLGTHDFVGDEAELYRQRVDVDLTPHLDTTSTAWSQVAAALHTYAGTLEDLQTRMAGLAARAADQQQQVRAADQQLAASRAADRQHDVDVAAARASLPPADLVTPSPFVSTTSTARGSLSNATIALQGTIDAAATLRSQHDAAVTTCCTAIDAARRLRFADPPGFWGRLRDSAVDWVTEHSGVLLGISAVLKTISAVSGILSMIPVLTPVMGPIALATGATALAIDVTVKLCTGAGSWTQIAIDTVALVPGVKSLTLLGPATGTLAAVGKAKKAWTAVELGASLTTAGLTTVQAVRGEASWADAVVAGLGVKLPGVGPGFKTAQGLVTSGAGLANQGWSMYDKVANGESLTWQDWSGLVLAGGKLAVTSGNAYAYRTQGVNPDGTRRQRNQPPKYRWEDSMTAFKQSAAETAAGAALWYAVQQGPVDRT